MSKRLLIVAHAPSPNTRRMLDAVLPGASAPDVTDVEAVAQSPFDTVPEHVMAAQAIILGTTENLGYMSGALKDFFDRCSYPCLEHTQGMPYAAYIRGRHDGTGTRRGIETITTGLRWRAVQEPLICRGDWREEFVEQCRDLGAAMAAGLSLGVF
jgi:multimeric flavodoxin WrbA